MNFFESNKISSTTATNFINRTPLKKDIYENSRNSNSTEIKSSILRKVHSNFTEDSSVSSTYSPVHLNNVHANSRSLTGSLNSVSRTYSSMKLCKSNTIQRRRVVFDDMVSRDLIVNFKPDLCPSQASNSSANEEVVKVTNASTLDLACIIRIETPQLKDYPEVIRPESNFRNYSENIYSRKQLSCDQQKLLNSSLLNDYYDDYTSEITSSPNILANLVRSFVARGVQTLPVLIFPVPMESDLKETNALLNNKINRKQKLENYDFKSIEMSTQKSEEENTKVETNHQETQAPPLQKPRTRTQSEFTTHSKDKETTDLLIESSLKTINSDVEETNISDVFWGDVYNDYKKQLLGTVEKPYLLKKPVKKPLTKFSSRLNKTPTLTSRTGGDLIRRTLENYAQRKGDNYLSVGSAVAPQNYKFKTKSKGTTMLDEIEMITEVQKFQKFYELPQFDDLVKSYLTSTDRRIKAVCSKVGCKIKMYGPIIRWQAENTSQPQSISHIKTFYYITVGANTKERLDKSVKCIQETFPKTYLNERCYNLPSLENCGDEIPL